MPGAVAVATPFITLTPLRSTTQVTCALTSIDTPLTTPVAMNCCGVEVRLPAAPGVSVTDAVFGLTSSDSRPLIGGGPEPPMPVRPVPPVPGVAPGFTPAQPP